MKFIVCFFSLFLFIAQIQGWSQSRTIEVIAYYSGNGKDLEQYSIEKLTQIIFSFLHLKDDTLRFPSDERKQALRRVVALKEKYPKLKVLISLGGWGGCSTCSEVFSTLEGRKNFAQSVQRVMMEYKVDGIDLDWEYPTILGYPGHKFQEADKGNFTDLVVQIRKAIGPEGQLSFAAGGFTEYLEKSVDWQAVMPHVNRVNLMTYDLVHGFSTQTGHHTALYSTASQKESTDNCVQFLLKKGIVPEKLVIGAAFYARIWEGVSKENQGLYKPGKFRQSLDYKHFEQLEKDSGWGQHWDNKALAPFAYHTTKNLFATYDNGRSLSEKVRYVQTHRLGGIMFWELTCDAPKGNSLLDQLGAALPKPSSQ